MVEEAEPAAAGPAARASIAAAPNACFEAFMEHPCSYLFLPQVCGEGVF
jgi:hypothetical protein